MITDIIENLQRGIRLLNSITDEQYSDTSVPPYFSSIGANMRHVLDVYSCVFNGLESNTIDFSDRARNLLSEQKTSFGIEYFNEVIISLENLNTNDFSKVVSVTDDLGSGRLTANYTLESVLLQAHSHTIHHFASIGFIIYQLKIELPDTDFGYNPTTPKMLKSN